MPEKKRTTDLEGRKDNCHIHVHTYLTETDVEDAHQHVVTGVTAPALMDGKVNHIHRIRIRTSYLTEETAGHWHWVDIMTGPPVELSEDSHVHHFTGETSTADGHSHTFSGSTGIGPNLLYAKKREEPDDDESE